MEENSFENDQSYTEGYETRILLLYEKTLSHVETSAFQPMFHNQQLTLKLILISIGRSYLDSYQNVSKQNIDYLKITCFKSSNINKKFRQVCDIYLNFRIDFLSSQAINLTLLSNNSTCLLSLTNKSDIIILYIHEIFSIDDEFRFTYKWSTYNQEKPFLWRSWPQMKKSLTSCLNYENKSTRSESSIDFLQCFSVDTLTHSTTQELFIREQEAISDWLDYQYAALESRTFFNKHKHLPNTRRLAPFEIAKNNQICSGKFQNWILNYQKWHQNISLLISNRSMTLEEQLQRIIELDVRILIYQQPGSGIADRVVHLISTYLVALLTNRLFIFDKKWPEFIDTTQSSLDYQPEYIIPWYSQWDSIKKKLSLDIQSNLTMKTYGFSLERYKNNYNYNKDFPERILVFKAHTGATVHTIQSKSSIYRKFLSIDLELSSDTIFGCLYHSLFTCRLSQFIKRFSLNSSSHNSVHSAQEILQTLLSPRFFPIGIQIRVGDKSMVQGSPASLNLNILKSFQNFFNCSHDLIKVNETVFRETNRTPIVFLLSDDVQIRQVALNDSKFSLQCFKSLESKCEWNTSHLNILTNSNPALHISYTNNAKLAFQLGIFDIFLFSLCEQHIITLHSGYGRIAAFASLKRQNIYSLLANQKHSCLNHSVPLAEAAYHWSGI